MEKELETPIQIVRIYSQEIRMEFGIEKCDMFVMRSGKRQMTDGIKHQIKKKSERSEKRKLSSTWEFWKRVPSNKRR